jgi:hypothetical protein
MIQELKTYMCDHTPKDDDILEAMKIVKNDNCVVKILWNVKYSGTYDVLVANDSTLESVKAQLPKIYPI